MPSVYEWFHCVRTEEIDGLGHANNVAYLAWMQAAAVAHSEAQGWPMHRYLELGCGWVVREHHVWYLRPATEGQAIVVQTWVADFRRISSTRKYRIVDAKNQTLLAQADTLWAFVDLKSFQPRRIPAELAACFPVVANGSC